MKLATVAVKKVLPPVSASPSTTGVAAPAPEKAPWWNTWAYVAGGLVLATGGVVAYNKLRR